MRPAAKHRWQLSVLLNTGLGSLPERRVTWGLVLLFSLWVLIDVFFLKFTGGLSRSSYDAMVRARVFVAAPDPRIVIIDIDEASLARMGKEFGRWPWPRDTLATVLNHIESQQPAAVVWDVVFSDADNISPGGDAAFNESALRSNSSHFPVVRLPAFNDASSQITRNVLPTLWVFDGFTGEAPKKSTVALIPPVLPAITNSRLGLNNGYVDPDGTLRRYRYAELLPDGSMLQSLPASVLRSLNYGSYQRKMLSIRGGDPANGELVAWRRTSTAYPHISFADVFAQAEGDMEVKGVPSFFGKIAIVGATAPSLHDIHATPVSAMQPGVDSLATALDNILNDRQLIELPRWLQALMAICLCVALAIWVQLKNLVSLQPVFLALPATLIGISYLSLNGSPFFLDLHLPAGLALLLLAVLRFWNSLRRNYWCAPLLHESKAMAIWTWERRDAWLEGSLDRLINAIEKHAPSFRVVLCDAHVAWPATLRWPELTRFVSLVGPFEDLQNARHALAAALRTLADGSTEPIMVKALKDRDHLVDLVFSSWVNLQESRLTPVTRVKN